MTVGAIGLKDGEAAGRIGETLHAKRAAVSPSSFISLKYVQKVENIHNFLVEEDSCYIGGMPYPLHPKSRDEMAWPLDILFVITKTLKTNSLLGYKKHFSKYILFYHIFYEYNLGKS